MKYIRYLFLLCLAVVLIAVALAFVVIFGGVVAGLLIGFVWEWLREHKHRVEVDRKAREVGKLEREVKKLKGEKNRGKDDVLALLD